MVPESGDLTRLTSAGFALDQSQLLLDEDQLPIRDWSGQLKNKGARVADNGEKKPSWFGGSFESLEKKDKDLKSKIIETKTNKQTKTRKKEMLAEKCKKKGNTIKVTLRKQLRHRPGIRKHQPSAMNMVLMW